MATGPRECKTYVLSASYRQDNHAPAVLPAVVLGGDEDDALGAATTASCAACIYIRALYSATQGRSRATNDSSNCFLSHE